MSKLRKFLIGVIIGAVSSAAIVVGGVNGAYVLVPWMLLVSWYLWFVEPQSTPQH